MCSSPQLDTSLANSLNLAMESVYIMNWKQLQSRTTPSQDLLVKRVTSTHYPKPPMASAVKPLAEHALAISLGKTEKTSRNKDSIEGEKELLLETALIVTDMSPKHELFAPCRSSGIAAIPNKLVSFSSMNKKLLASKDIFYMYT